MKPEAVFDIAIIGCGFSGGMTLRHLVQSVPQGTHIAVFDESAAVPLGPAYSTKRMEHLLNVRAGRMGALQDNHGHFYAWLSASERAEKYSAEDFVPRRIYGEYLTALHEETLAFAKSRGVEVNIVRERVLHITTGFSLHTERGEYAARHVILTSGLEFAVDLENDPWRFDYDMMRGGDGRVLILGTGLTAVDAVMSLLKAGFRGNIDCVSRRGKFPQAHANAGAAIKVTPPQGPIRLSTLVHWMRAAADKYAWRDVVDALRPHTLALWQVLSAQDKRRALKHFTWWNIHRHRMAPEIHEALEAALARGQVKCVHARDVNRAEYDHVIDCRGPGYGALPEFLTPLLEGGQLRRHETGAGLAADAQGCVYDGEDASIHAVGALLLGERLETTAVPELRAQAYDVAQAVIDRLSAED